MQGLIVFMFGIAIVGIPSFAAFAGPLHDAAKAGNQAAVLKALEGGAKINGRDTEGKTALYLAVAGNHLGVARLLLTRGAKPDVMNLGIQGEIDAPIYIATRKGNLEAIRLLAAKKANLTLSGIYAAAPYAMALKYKQKQAAALLKKLGAANYNAPSIRALLGNANVKLGRLLIKTCNKCHALKPGDKPTGRYAKPFGPSLWYIVGRKKAGVPGAEYSTALHAAKGVWSFDDLNSYLANPSAFIPGTNKWYLIKKQRLRVAIIAHLRILSDQPVPIP